MDELWGKGKSPERGIVLSPAGGSQAPLGLRGLRPGQASSPQSCVQAGSGASPTPGPQCQSPGLSHTLVPDPSKGSRVKAPPVQAVLRILGSSAERFTLPCSPLPFCCKSCRGEALLFRLAFDTRSQKPKPVSSANLATHFSPLTPGHFRASSKVPTPEGLRSLFPTMARRAIYSFRFSAPSL